MENETWSFKKTDLFTVPNLLTYMRFVLVAPFIYFFLQQNYIAAAVCNALIYTAAGMLDPKDRGWK